MSHGFHHHHHHPNHRETASFREERYCASNNNRAEFRQKDDYYKTEAYCGEAVHGRPLSGNHTKDKVVDYEFSETVKEEVVLDECAQRKHHGHCNRVKPF